MMVLILERLKPGLRGELTRWMIEPRPGVFIGRVSALVRDKLWSKVCNETPLGAACTMVYSTNNEQGFSVRSFGDPAREIVDFDGLFLVRRSRSGRKR